MSPFDLAVLFFFICVTVKAAHDAFLFWQEEDELYASLVDSHNSAPVRRSPSSIRASYTAAGPVRPAARREITPLPVKMPPEDHPRAA
ncbi:MAG: hypothetical protein IJ869_07185 [Clostridiales bacterium]|nr:hypothetical protein [Clostridiales bacterium]